MIQINKKLAIIIPILTFFSFITIIKATKYISTTKDFDIKKLYVDFNTSMLWGFTQEEYDTYFATKKQNEFILLFKSLYEKNNFLKKDLPLSNTTKTTKIPKIIHQIWLGSPFPESYKKYQESWIKLHPDWEYRLWTEADIADFKLVNQKEFDTARNYAQQSDIWRYEILERFGGVYADADFEALQKLDMLNDLYEFYAGIAPINRIAIVNNAIIGSAPHHPILQELVKDIPLYKKKFPTTTLPSTGPIYFTNKIINFCFSNNNANTDDIILLPASYLYPIAYAMTPEELTKINLSTSFAIHYWASQWV